MRYFPLTGSTTETIPKTENLHLLLLHHCHFISINPQCDFTTEQSAALCPLKKSQAKTEERARRGCYRKTSSPFPKGLRAPTASPAAQLLCIIGLFHIFFLSAAELEAFKSYRHPWRCAQICAETNKTGGNGVTIP